MKIATLASLCRRAALLAALLAIAAGAGWSAAAPTSGFIQYEVTASTAGQPPVKSVEKLWFKGRRFRRESITPAGKIVTLGGPGATFLIFPHSSGALEQAGSARAMPGIPGLPMLDVTMIPRRAHKVGAEKVGRYQAEVYESRHSSRRPAGAMGSKAPVQQEMTSRFWISRDLPVPVKSMTQIKGAPSSQSVTVLTAVRLNIPVPDSMLQLPKGTKILPPAPPGRPVTR